jgi:hypothetical protein
MRNMCDLQRSEDDLSVADDEMRADFTVGETKFLRRHKRNDDRSRSPPESVRLDDDHKWDRPAVPARVAVDTELIRHQRVLNSSAIEPCFATKAASADI